MNTSTSSSDSLCPDCGRTNYGKQIHCLVCDAPLTIVSQITQPKSRLKFCTSCGTILQAQGKFCTNCGKQI